MLLPEINKLTYNLVKIPDSAISPLQRPWFCVCNAELDSTWLRRERAFSALSSPTPTTQQYLKIKNNGAEPAFLNKKEGFKPQPSAALFSAAKPSRATFIHAPNLLGRATLL